MRDYVKVVSQPESLNLQLNRDNRASHDASKEGYGTVMPQKDTKKGEVY